MPFARFNPAKTPLLSRFNEARAWDYLIGLFKESLENYDSTIE